MSILSLIDSTYQNIIDASGILNTSSIGGISYQIMCLLVGITAILIMVYAIKFRTSVIRTMDQGVETLVQKFLEVRGGGGDGRASGVGNMGGSTANNKQSPQNVNSSSSNTGGGSGGKKSSTQTSPTEVLNKAGSSNQEAQDTAQNVASGGGFGGSRD